MKEPRIDDERLSALLDGRMDPREREALLAQLAASDDDYHVFTDTAAVLREMGETEGTRPLQVAAARWTVAARWAVTALAAVLAAVVLVPALSPGRGPAGDPVRLASQLQGEGLPEGWTRRARWFSERGGASPATPGERAAQAARAGALMMDLSVAVRARDSADTRLLAEQVRRRFDSMAGGASPFARIAAGAGSPPEALEPLLAEGTERLAERLGKDHLHLGAWAEAGRLAAHARNERFFRSDASRDMLRLAERLTASDPPARAAAARIRSALAAEGAPPWEELSGSMDALLIEVAS